MKKVFLFILFLLLFPLILSIMLISLYADLNTSGIYKRSEELQKNAMNKGNIIISAIIIIIISAMRNEIYSLLTKNDPPGHQGGNSAVQKNLPPSQDKSHQSSG